ncbi:glycosyltransferase family 25 protein [Glaciecola sp. 1036]|uniref:glycosyltransferase family 25 protein n=1 Tax=Alteromonadaceae TaxID=72275 RepID=UPI003D014DE9
MTPVFLINLDRSPDRYAFSAKQLGEYSIAFQRIQAVDGVSPLPNKFDNIIADDFSGYYKKLSNAELGCYLSHKNCWEIIVKQNIEYAIVLEDDFLLTESFPAVVQQLSNLPIEWDCLKLAEHPAKRHAVFELPFQQWQLVVYNKVPARTGAYAISLSGAKKMLAHAEKVARPVDIDFQYWWEMQLDIFGLKPYPVLIDTNKESTIDNNGKGRKKAEKSFYKQVRQKLAFTTQNIIKTNQRVRALKQKYPDGKK